MWSVAARGSVKLALLLLVALWLSAVPANAWSQGARSQEHERYAGEAQIGSEPPFPIHIDLRRSGAAVEGVISTPGATANLTQAQGTSEVRARFGGPAGTGNITFRFSHDRVEGEFDLGGQRGTLSAQRTAQDAASFFRGPEQRLDLTTDEWRRDLERLAEILITRHGSPFHRTSREAFSHEVTRIRAALPTLSGPEVVVEFGRLAALIGDGHTWVEGARGRPRFNLELFWFEDGLRLIGIEAIHRHLLGARLVAVGSLPASQVVRRLRVFASQGETEWSYRAVAPHLIASPDVLRAAGIGGGATRHFTFRTSDGRTHRLLLAAVASRPQRVLLGGGRPLWDRGEEAFRVERLPDGTLYVNWRNYDGLAEHAASLLARLDRDRPCRLILDLRDNGGGDYNHGRAFITQLTARDWLNHADRLFVLTGRGTFSAAMTNAVDFKRSTRATLVGEPPGAAPNNWQEIRRFHLPLSGLAVGVSTRYYEFLPGERALRPNLHIPPVPSDWGAPYDAAVRRVVTRACPAGVARAQ